MLSALGLDRALILILRAVMRLLVRFSCSPSDVGATLAAVPRPICYALQIRQLSALLVLEEAAERLGLPGALRPLTAGPISERSAFFFLTRSGQPSPLQPNPYQYSERLERMVAAAWRGADIELAIVPVSIFWGRAPEKQESIFKALLADTWVVPGTFRQLLRLLIHGRQTLLKFGEPILLGEVIAQVRTEGLDERMALRRVARLLRAEFRRERELAVGPNLSHRQTLVNELVASPAVRQAVAEEAQRSGIPVREAELKARRIAYGIASDYSYAFVRAADLALTALWNRIYGGVEVHRFEDVPAAGIGAELVYVPCHRSHIDYMLMSYVIYHRGLLPPHIAAGDNLNLPLVGALLRRGGAFFLRRSFKGDALYATVFSEYLHTIISRGFPIEYFVEAGRSRTGRMLSPRAGMLAMTVESFLRDSRRPLVFIPVYIGYEQLLEGETYIAELSGQPKQKESVLGVLATLRKLARRFGRVHVNIAEPIELGAFLDARWPAWRAAAEARESNGRSPSEGERHRVVSELATAIVTRINDALVVNPINLVAVAMLGAPRQAMDAQRLADQIELLKRLLFEVRYSERQVVTPLNGRAVIEYAEALGIVQRIAHPLGDIVRVPGRQAVLLGYFRNNVLHAFVLPALIACLIARNVRIETARLREIACRLFPFFRSELYLSWSGDELEGRIERYLEAFRLLHLVGENGGRLAAPTPAQQESLALHSLAQAIRQPLERYFMVVATLVSYGSGTLTAKRLEERSFLLGQRLAYLHEPAGPEFFDRAAFRSIIGTLIDIGSVVERDGVLELTPGLERIAGDAEYVLSEDARLAISHVAQVSDSDIARAQAALEAMR